MKITSATPLNNKIEQVTRKPLSDGEIKDNFLPSPKGEDDKEKHKLLLLQFDGLSKPALERAMKNGDAPNIKNLLERGTHILRSYSSGISPITNAVISSILYGVELPGNEWYDKETGKKISAPLDEDNIEAEAQKEGKEFLVADGVVYSSPLSGGAEETAGVVGNYKDDIKKYGLIKAFIREAKDDISLLKHGGRSISKVGAMFLKDMVKVAGKLIKDGRLGGGDESGPLMISLNDNLLAPIATEGVKKAIDDHKPIAYVDFAGFDYNSHFLGNDSKDAINSIKEIDKSIGEILEKADASGDKYDVVIFSDHGHTSSKIFSRLYGKSAEETIKDIAESCNPDNYIRGDLALTDTKTVNNPDRNRHGDIVFTDADSMGNIYFTKDKKSSVDIKEIEKTFPGFTDKLIKHPGIGLVVTRDDKNFVLKGKEGSLKIDGEGKLLDQEGKNPLDHFGEEGLIRKQMINYMKLPHTGDIIVFGEYDGQKVVDLHERRFLSTHGGLGGEQNQPFIITPSNLPLANKDIDEATEFHDILCDIKDNK
jgi:hypothetical protein